MTRAFIQILFFILPFNMAYSQLDTIYNAHLSHDTSPYPPLYVIDGLRISQEKFAELKIDKHCIKRIKVEEENKQCDSTQNFSGIIRVYSKMLIVLNDSLLADSNDKIETLSNIKRDAILSINKIDKQEALSKYGKIGKHGALIIRTK